MIPNIREYRLNFYQDVQHATITCERAIHTLDASIVQRSLHELLNTFSSTQTMLRSLEEKVIELIDVQGEIEQDSEGKSASFDKKIVDHLSDRICYLHDYLHQIKPDIRSLKKALRCRKQIPQKELSIVKALPNSYQTSLESRVNLKKAIYFPSPLSQLNVRILKEAFFTHQCALETYQNTSHRFLKNFYEAFSSPEGYDKLSPEKKVKVLQKNKKLFDCLPESKRRLIYEKFHAMSPENGEILDKNAIWNDLPRLCQVIHEEFLR